MYLSVIDYFSRFPFLFELQKATAEEVVGKLKELVSLVGPCKTLITDNGTVFHSSEFNRMAVMMGIQHKYTSVYRPTANGIVERFHGSLKSKLDRTFTDSSICADDAIRQALFDIRTSPNASTSATPFSRFYGREARSPVANALSRPAIEKPNPANAFAKGSRILYRRGRVDAAFLRKGVVERVLSPRCVLVRDSQTGRTFSLNTQYCRRDPSRPGFTTQILCADLPCDCLNTESPSTIPSLHTAASNSVPTRATPAASPQVSKDAGSASEPNVKGRYHLRSNFGISPLYK